MGCGGGVKETNETVRRQTFTQAKIQPGIRRAPPDARGKLPPEVLDGFAKLIKSFYNVGALKQPVVTARPGDTAQNESSASKLHAEELEKQRKRAELEAEEAKKLQEYSTKSVANPFQDLLKGEQQREEVQAEQRRKAEEEKRKADEMRYSPEPPRPEEYSDEEGNTYEDPEMRRARLEKERLAKEEAERRAAEMRLEEERIAAQRKGVMNNMQSEADSILSKYQ